MDSFALVIQLLLAVVFATAGVGKLLDRAGSRTALAAFGVPEAVVPVASVLLPAAELATAVALAGSLVRWRAARRQIAIASVSCTRLRRGGARWRATRCWRRWRAW
jgi:uncharacterized membrane protein YphA (DoxX/SURF4 family)